MLKKNFFIVLLTFTTVVLLFSANATRAKKIKTRGNTIGNSSPPGRQYKTCHAAKIQKSPSQNDKRKIIKDSDYITSKQTLTKRDPSIHDNNHVEGCPRGKYAPGFSGPPWFINQTDFPGGPSWMGETQERKGPWFWQVYTGHDVTDRAPKWFLDHATAKHGPAWLYKKSDEPWWSYYLLNTENK